MKTELPKEITGMKVNSSLIHQVVVSQMANRRKNIAHTKDRSEKRGGGRKPWRQKGTGRARHGSIRSPLWKGGGVTFGPRKEKNYSKKIPLKMKRKAVLMVLAAKAENDLILFKEALKASKTKELAELMPKDNCLIVLGVYDRNLVLASRNIPNLKVMEAKELNALDLLSYKHVVLDKEAVKVIKQTFLK